jgi:hypothetical protein
LQSTLVERKVCIRTGWNERGLRSRTVMVALSLFSFPIFFCLENISRTICWGGQGVKLIIFFQKQKLLVWNREVTLVVVVLVM